MTFKFKRNLEETISATLRRKELLVSWGKHLVGGDGISYYRQSCGLPMGTSFSSALANIFLHTSERKFIKNNLISAYRYIDDLIVFDNLDTLINSYPEELKLNKTNNNNNNCNYLDPAIKIIDSSISVGIYDKRDDFNFRAISLCHYHTNLNLKVIKNTIHSQVKRIKNICNNHSAIVKATDNLNINLKLNGYPGHYFIINN
ncbi:hypothetical protein AVEN_273996-1 [Araneus ventricosus]|uniref:Reverse transcriptase domain-containing protein n=1 Tax=Araneus ventricosus TaxID=182803 RepID=A0A4Y2SDA6_ARAVE|nr:hypothetical protein AVEN_273996-1 [Araneus ventricosus]